MNKRYKLLKEAKETKKEETWREYKRVRNEVTQKLRLTEATYWKNKFNKNKSSRDFWRLVKKVTSREINNVISKGETTADGKKVKLDFFLGGDMKFLLMVMGLSGATSTYACLWCKIHKDERWEMSQPKDFYCTVPMKRTLQEIKDMSKLKTDNFCCIHEPLLNIELDHVILDELHLLLRITDRLLDNVITECEERERRENSTEPSRETLSSWSRLLIKWESLFQFGTKKMLMDLQVTKENAQVSKAPKRRHCLHTTFQSLLKIMAALKNSQGRLLRRTMTLPREYSSKSQTNGMPRKTFWQLKTDCPSCSTMRGKEDSTQKGNMNTGVKEFTS